MTRSEAIKLVGAVVAAYPTNEKIAGEKNIRAMVDLYADIFTDDDFNTAMAAVRMHVNASKWPPSVAEIRECMTKVQTPKPDITWMKDYIDYSGIERAEA